jgi:hypothetical protein
MYRWMDRLIEQTNRKMVGWTDIWMESQMDGQKDGWTNRWEKRQMIGQTDDWTDR